ncbi:hypothetical protein JTB14_022290 [Gonioctena quinquepunctata]|nr:hypothetical protein JTB14_022290 [Gonioctena quinquepunctata]
MVLVGYDESQRLDISDPFPQAMVPPNHILPIYPNHVLLRDFLMEIGFPSIIGSSSWRTVSKTSCLSLQLYIAPELKEAFIPPSISSTIDFRILSEERCLLRMQCLVGVPTISW